MAQSVDNVIDSEFVSLIGEIDGHPGLVRPLPDVTDVIVEIDDDLKTPGFIG